jgi:hypothetical protein
VTDNPYASINHELTDEAATRRALEALDALTEEAGVLREKIINDSDIGGDATKRLASLTRDVVQHVSILAAFLDVGEFGPEELIRRLQKGL